MSAQLELAYEPFVLPSLGLQTRIERHVCGKGTGNWIEGWRLLREQGWDVQVLLAPDSKTLVALACRGEA